MTALFRLDAHVILGHCPKYNLLVAQMSTFEDGSLCMLIFLLF